MTRLYPDLGSASDWLEFSFNQSEELPRFRVETRHQYGIPSALITQTSFCEGSKWRPCETSAVFSG